MRRRIMRDLAIIIALAGCVTDSGPSIAEQVAAARVPCNQIKTAVAWQKCMTAAESSVMTMTPARAWQQAAMLELAQKLEGGQITKAQWELEKAKIYTEATRRFQEEADRRRYLSALEATSYQTSTPAPDPAPRNVTCRQLGNSTYCNSY
jgi:hypothetical protein